MRAVMVLALGALSACVSIGRPAETGMTVSQHAATCTDGGRQIVSELIGVLVGECTAKPEEYVVFTQGKVSHIYSADDIAEAMLVACPADRLQECENDIRSNIANRTEKKRTIAADLLSAKSQRLSAGLGQLSTALMAMDSAGYDTGTPAPSFSPAAVASCRYNPATGRNQLCHTVDATGRCLMFSAGGC